MKRIKCAQRNRLKQQQLNCLIMISVEGPAADKFNFGMAADQWAAQKARRINIK